MIVNQHCFNNVGTFNLQSIIKIQSKFKAYLKQIVRRKKKMKQFTGRKISRPIFKIILLQKFIRYIILKKKCRPLINKNMLNSQYFISKEIASSSTLLSHSRNQGQQNTNTINIIELNNKKKIIKYTKPLSQEYYTKTIKPIYRIKNIQKAFENRLRKESLVLPKIKQMSFFRKRIQYQDYNTPITLIQRQIRYLFFQLNNKLKIINKQRIPRMKYTKVIITTFKQILNRAIKVRLDFDKELMNLVLTVDMILRRYYGKLFFQLLNYNGILSKNTNKISNVVFKKKINEPLYELNDDPLDEICLRGYIDTKHLLDQRKNIDSNSNIYK